MDVCNKRILDMQRALIIVKYLNWNTYNPISYTTTSVFFYRHAMAHVRTSTRNSHEIKQNGIQYTKRNHPVAHQVRGYHPGNQQMNTPMNDRTNRRTNQRTDVERSDNEYVICKYCKCKFSQHLFAVIYSILNH